MRISEFPKRPRAAGRRRWAVGRVTSCLAIAIVLLFGAGAAAAAQEMPRLPGPIKMTRSGESPGQVVFNHETHVDSSKPACTACHPREFRILKTSRRAPITHADMDNGRNCGMCHDGKKAFTRDDCASCHQD